VSELQTFINGYCEDFSVHIELMGGEVFIEIKRNDSFYFHNANVALGQEVEGLTMLMAEYQLMSYGVEFNDTIH